MATVSGLVAMYEKAMGELSDPRTADWFLMSSPWPTYVMVLMYLIFVYQGPKWMKDRPAFDLKLVMLVYNFCLVILSAYIFYEFLVTSWLRKGFSLVCQDMDYSNDPSSVRLASVCWMFFFSKLIELMDTVFFILRKKDNQISFLHVYHHSTMPLLWWIGIRFIAGGEAYFSASINSFIHILMYLYYLLAAGGPRMQRYLWWKKYMTTLQLVQFWAIVLHTIYAMYVRCAFPIEYGWALLAYTFSHIVLFSNFYYQNYTKKAAAKRKDQVSNGAVGNRAGNHSSRKRE